MKRALILTLLVGFQGHSQTTAPEQYWKQAKVSETNGNVQIQVNSPRPITQVLEALQEKYRWVVNYEDPQFTAAVDQVEQPGTNGKLILPTGGKFEVEFPAKSPDEEKTLRSLVDSYNRSKNPGRFELRTANSLFYIVGTGAHDNKGAIANQTVVLDLPVTPSAEEHTITDALNEICEQISAQSHITVIVGISPRNVLDHNSVKLSATKAPAREVIQQCFEASHHKLYWRLLYDASSERYLLNIHSVRS
jgi:hypothetical protein